MSTQAPQREDLRPFTAEERLVAHLSPCGLGLALDMRQVREATDEERDSPPPVFVRSSWLAHLDHAIVEGVAGRLQATTTPGSPARGLIVQAPPRHGKSYTTSIFTPAWFLGLFPRKRVILVSNEAQLAREFGQPARDLLEDAGPLVFGTGVPSDRRAAGNWKTIQGGGMLSVGRKGSITGKGADLLILDDPFKNAEEASSPVLRESVWDLWVSTLRPRLHPGAFVLIVLTRWHEDDIAGRLLKQARENPGADQWHELRFPALAEPGDPLGRQVGEALWPARYSATELEQTRQSSGAYWWGAMYQQHPSPDDGGVFARRHLRSYEIVDWRDADPGEIGEGRGSWLSTGRVPSVVQIPEHNGRPALLLDLSHARLFQTVDLAASEKTTADYTVVTTFASAPTGELLVLDVERRRIPGPDQPDALEACLHGWGVESQHIEIIGYQTSLIQALSRRGLPVLPLTPDKDKVTRASTAAARYKAGMVLHPAGAPWLDALEAEMLAFPVGEHDDQVDTIAYGARVAMNLPGRVRQTRASPTRRTLVGGIDPRSL